MKKGIHLFTLAIALTSLIACQKVKVKPSSTVTQETRNISGFNGVDVASALNVYLTYSENEEQVLVEANSNLHEYIETDVIDGKLRVRLKNNTRIKSNPTLNIHITSANIGSMDLSGASTVQLENEFLAENLHMDISGASSLKGNVDLDRCVIELSGASEVDLFGKINDAEVDMSGASGLEGYDLFIETLNIDMSGASGACLTVSNTLNVDASGASSLRYKGDATLGRMETSGASSVTKRN